jgi:hypothetical protein
MRVNRALGEDAPMSDDPRELDEVARRVGEIQRQRRGRLRWHIGKHTAELAIDALELTNSATRRNGKPRRRKRRKRLL